MPTANATATSAATTPTVDIDRRKSAAVSLYGSGWRPGAIAEALGVSRQTVYRWIREVAEAVGEISRCG
jgi:transposase